MNQGVNEDIFWDIKFLVQQGETNINKCFKFKLQSADKTHLLFEKEGDWLESIFVLVIPQL